VLSVCIFNIYGITRHSFVSLSYSFKSMKDIYVKHDCHLYRIINQVHYEYSQNYVLDHTTKSYLIASKWNVTYHLINYFTVWNKIFSHLEGLFISNKYLKTYQKNIDTTCKSILWCVEYIFLLFIFILLSLVWFVVQYSKVINSYKTTRNVINNQSIKYHRLLHTHQCFLREIKKIFGYFNKKKLIFNLRTRLQSHLCGECDIYRKFDNTHVSLFDSAFYLFI
jgi:hypothetical protein